MISLRLSAMLKTTQGASLGTLLNHFEDSTAAGFRKHQVG